jgi:hypothetical protein
MSHDAQSKSNLSLTTVFGSLLVPASKCVGRYTHPLTVKALGTGERQYCQDEGVIRPVFGVSTAATKPVSVEAMWLFASRAVTWHASSPCEPVGERLDRVKVPIPLSSSPTAWVRQVRSLPHLPPLPIQLARSMCRCAESLSTAAGRVACCGCEDKSRGKKQGVHFHHSLGLLNYFLKWTFILDFFEHTIN